MANSREDIMEQLELLRALTASTGVIHEAQAEHLRVWGTIAAPHAERFSISVDINSKSVDYSLKHGDKARPPANYALRLQRLAEAVKMLLGPDWAVTVRVGKSKPIFSVGHGKQSKISATPSAGRRTRPARGRGARR